MDHFFRQVRLGAHDRPVSVDSRHYQPPPIRGDPGLAERFRMDAATPDHLPFTPPRLDQFDGRFPALLHDRQQRGRPHTFVRVPAARRLPHRALVPNNV